MSAVSAALGPSLCGVLISGFDLQAIFLVNVSLGALTFLLASRSSRRPQGGEDRRGRLRRDGYAAAGLTLVERTECESLTPADLPLPITRSLKGSGGRICVPDRLFTEPDGHAVIVIAEDHCSSARPACGLSRRRHDNGYEQEGRYYTPAGRKAPEKASRSSAKRGAAAPKRAQSKAMTGSRSATKSQAVPAKSRSAAGSRTAARSTSGASRSRSQGGVLNPMAWLSSLETTLTSPQARAVMAEALGQSRTCLRSRRAANRDRAAQRSRAGMPCRRQEASAPRSSPLRWRLQRRPLEPQGRW